MEQTLKELAGDLQVIHESLERAEAVERQLNVYWREFEAERDQLRAELAEERARRKALDRNWDLLQRGERDATARAEAAESTAAGLLRALEEIQLRIACCQYEGALGIVGIALSASPDEHERRNQIDDSPSRAGSPLEAVEAAEVKP